MLNFAPSNTVKQKKLLTQKATQLAQEAWRIAEPWWLDTLRRCSTPDIYDTDSTVTLTPLRAASPIHGQFVCANNKGEARADAIFAITLDPFEVAFGTFLESEDNKKLHSTAHVPLAQPVVYASHGDVDTWDPQRPNPRPRLPTETVIFEGTGLVELVYARCTRQVRRRGRRRGKRADEATKSDTVAGRTEVASSRKTNGVMRPVSFEMPVSLAWSSVEE
jgi:hypothetical protein